MDDFFLLQRTPIDYSANLRKSGLFAVLSACRAKEKVNKERPFLFGICAFGEGETKTEKAEILNLRRMIKENYNHFLEEDKKKNSLVIQRLLYSKRFGLREKQECMI